MSDIFISYSRKDSEQALSLAERLRGEGMSVWIDQQGIEAAKTWSEEIVNAIEGSKAFVLLLSSSSVESGNVAKELSLAYEAERPLVPVALEDVALTPKFKYPLAGVQRVAYTQFDAITSALIACGVAAEKPATKKTDKRKSVLVMPFEDLSPTQDNLWFADGLAGELIDKLSHIKSLRLIDRKTSRDLRASKLSIYQIAETLHVQYVIEGSVRKFGDQIKISTSLLDVREGEYLWQESHKGAMEQVFELQENVADRVVAGLTLHLGADEVLELKRKKTSNAQAYEHYLKAVESHGFRTRERSEQAISHYQYAIELDPDFIDAMGNLAVLHLELHQRYRSPVDHLAEAEKTIDRLKAITGDSPKLYWLLSLLALRTRDAETAEQYALRGIAMDATYANVYDALGFALKLKSDKKGAAAAWQTFANLRPDSYGIYITLLEAYKALGDREHYHATAVKALPLLEQRLKLAPDDHYQALHRARILAAIDRTEDARYEAERLNALPNLDSAHLYECALLWCDLGERGKALNAFEASIDVGFANMRLLEEDADLDPIRSEPEFERLRLKLEKILSEKAD
jgi:adenylate cyclase